MYVIKNIITTDEIFLPKCMYHLKPIYSSNVSQTCVDDEVDTNIKNQVIKFLKIPNPKMAELEKRQDQLLKKLDILYGRIKTISSYCNVTNLSDNKTKEMQDITFPEEVVLIVSSDSLPWYLKFFLKGAALAVNISWHIHSSVSNDKQSKIKAFMQTMQSSNTSKINLRLIFKCVSADTELRLSALDVPVIGNVNILRYLSNMCPSFIAYDQDDYYIDSLLDLCHLMERSTDKRKEEIIKKIFSQYKVWIYKSKFSIVDLAVFNAIKQSRNSIKFVPKEWLEKCEKMCL